jgi:pyruvate/2-oxoglutarate dehydrogenase complex dihydrolipoamide dehydrogenase (E3) component
MNDKPEFDLCVIGGGAAGLTVAAGGAVLGAKVALVEKRALGGDCLYYGCVPSKTLLHSAKVAQTLREAHHFGLPAHLPDVSLRDVMDRVQSVIQAIEPHDSPERFRGLGVEVVFGEGHFIDPRMFQVNDRPLTAKNFVLATGSRPAIPPIEGLEQVPYLTNETVFALREEVEHLIVLGAGPIGLELAQAFRRLGSQVDVVEMAPQAMPREDGDLTEIVAGQLRQEGMRLHFGHRVLGVEGGQRDLRVFVRDGNGQEKWLTGTHLLVATGRKANVEDLGLEAAGVHLENGRLVTDRRLRTSNPRIYACGDVAGPYLFTHMAAHQAGVVLRNALFHWPARVEERVIPWCTFTDPEMARVGLSETEVKSQGIPHRVYTFPFESIDRAQTDGATVGRAKIVTNPRGKLLGAALVGPHAGELIHEYVLALTKGMKASDLAGVIHIYPTLAEINRRVAEERLKEALTPTRKRWMKRLFRLRGG